MCNFIQIQLGVLVCRSQARTVQPQGQSHGSILSKSHWQSQAWRPKSVSTLLSSWRAEDQYLTQTGEIRLRVVKSTGCSSRGSGFKS